MDKTYNIKITSQAEEQIQEIIHYITHELKTPDAALHLLNKFEDAFTSLANFPQRVALIDEEPWHTIPAGMELFKAGKSQMKTIQKWIDDSDVYMLIPGGRCGTIEEESGLSYTELEYTYALSKKMPVFVIALDDSFLFTKSAYKGKDTIFEKDPLAIIG